MKKQIEIVRLNRTEAIRLSSIPEASFLSGALAELLDGGCQSLLLELGDDLKIRHDPEIRCGDLVIDPITRKVSRGAETLILTPKEFDILVFLASNRGQVFTKEQIYQAVWDGDYMLDSSNVMAFIRKLRKKIEPSPDAPQYILTVWGIGYKFNEENPDTSRCG